jgi:hypothetical protein
MRLRKGIEIGETDIDLKKDLNNDESSNEKGNVIVLVFDCKQTRY